MYVTCANQNSAKLSRIRIPKYEISRMGSAYPMLLTTDRLTLRPFQEADVTPYSEIVADPEVMRLITGEAETFEAARRYLEEVLRSEAERGYSRYAVLLREPEELIGFCGFKLIDGEVDFGWRYGKRHWNNGYGTEAAREVLKYGQEILQLPLVVSVALPENTASIRIMQKIGMQRDGFGSWGGKQTIRYVARTAA